MRRSSAWLIVSGLLAIGAWVLSGVLTYAPSFSQYGMTGYQGPAWVAVENGSLVFQAAAGVRQRPYPNLRHSRTGKRVQFFNYDPDDKGWYVYGMGTITATQVLPDPELRLYAFYGRQLQRRQHAAGRRPEARGLLLQ